LFLSIRSLDPRALHSFPTRRSSDLSRSQKIILSPRRFQKVREEIGGTYSPWPVSDASETFPGYGYLVANVDVDPATAEKISDLVDRKSTRLNSSHVSISYAVFCLKK